MDFVEVNMFYANLGQAMGLYVISAAFLLWLGLRATSVVVERETDNILYKGLAVILGIDVSANFILVGSQMALTFQNHAFALKQLAANGTTSTTAEAFIARMGVGDTVPELSLTGNPVMLVIGLVGLAFCILPLFVSMKPKQA